jgi:hypothetical protein
MRQALQHDLDLLGGAASRRSACSWSCRRGSRANSRRRRPSAGRRGPLSSAWSSSCWCCRRSLPSPRAGAASGSGSASSSGQNIGPVSTCIIVLLRRARPGRPRHPRATARRKAIGPEHRRFVFVVLLELRHPRRCPRSSAAARRCNSAPKSGPLIGRTTPCKAEPHQLLAGHADCLGDADHRSARKAAAPCCDGRAPSYASARLSARGLQGGVGQTLRSACAAR